MGAIKLDPCGGKTVNGVSVDPNPNWSFEDLLSELNSLESKLNASPVNPKCLDKSASRGVQGVGRSERNGNKAFVMRISDDELDDKEEAEARSLVPVGRFACDDIYLSESDDSEDESMQQLQIPLMEKMGVVEGALLELTHQYQLGIKEDIRNHISALEAELVAEKEKSASALVQVDKNSEARREMDKKLDMQYQRRIAEALDDHLTAIQRDHEHRSQIEERKIRDDAALEEAKRQERASQEEKLRQQKAKAEEEARREAAKRAGEERKAAEEADRVAKEAAEKMAKEKLAKGAVNAKTETMGQKKDTGPALPTMPSTVSAPNIPKGVQTTGNLVRAAENALKLEERRLLKYKELEDKNQPIISSYEKEFRSKEREIARRIKQITGSVAAVRSKANELVKLFNDPHCPQSVTVAMFAKKVFLPSLPLWEAEGAPLVRNLLFAVLVISIYETPTANFNSSAFACGHVIVYISAQVPAVMDCLLAEFHKACIYTVPKHVIYSKAAFEANEAYFRAIGYREEEGKLETTEKYLERLGSYMKLYGALVQTEAQGVQNMHGLEEGWVWLARFLNNLPANVYTAVALEAFLRMAGFALHRKYKSQFRKILKAISEQFIQALKDRGDPRISSVITRLQDYMESNAFLKEPEGWRLKDSLLSSDLVPDADHRQQHYYSQDRHFYYQR